MQVGIDKTEIAGVDLFVLGLMELAGIEIIQTFILEGYHEVGPEVELFRNIYTPPDSVPSLSQRERKESITKSSAIDVFLTKRRATTTNAG